MSAEIENHTYHDCRDIIGNAMVAGTYLMTRVGDDARVVDVVEDQITGDLSFRHFVEGAEVCQRVEELASDVTFSRYGD